MVRGLATSPRRAWLWDLCLFPLLVFHPLHVLCWKVLAESWGRARAVLPVLSNSPGAQVWSGEWWANGNALKMAFWPVSDGGKGPWGGRDAHLSWNTLAARKGRCWGYAADLIMQCLSAQSLGYYLHRVLRRLGPKKIHRTAVGLWKLFSSVWLLKMNLHQSFHGSLPPTPSPLVSAILSERRRKRAGPGEYPHPALFVCPASHPENAKCFTKVAEVGAVHRL